MCPRCPGRVTALRVLASSACGTTESSPRVCVVPDLGESHSGVCVLETWRRERSCRAGFHCPCGESVSAAGPKAEELVVPGLVPRRGIEPLQEHNGKGRELTEPFSGYMGLVGFPGLASGRCRLSTVVFGSCSDGHCGWNRTPAPTVSFGLLPPQPVSVDSGHRLGDCLLEQVLTTNPHAPHAFPPVPCACPPQGEAPSALFRHGGAKCGLTPVSLCLPGHLRHGLKRHCGQTQAYVQFPTSLKKRRSWCIRECAGTDVP